MSGSVVAVMAHPDDIEIHILGTLALLKDRGFDVHFVTVCRGDVGSKERSREETAAMRFKEAEASARLFGATYDNLGWDDLRAEYSMELKTRIVSTLRRHRADFVITHAREDYMADHEFTSMLAREACFAAPAPNWPTPDQEQCGPIHAIPEFYYADPTSQHDRDGEFVKMPIVVDVSSMMDRKEACLACHDSQRSWLRSQHGEDNYILSMREWSRVRGEQIGVAYGEGLRQHLGYPFPKSSKLIETLGTLAHGDGKK